MNKIKHMKNKLVKLGLVLVFSSMTFANVNTNVYASTVVSNNDISNPLNSAIISLDELMMAKEVKEIEETVAAMSAGTLPYVEPTEKVEVEEAVEVELTIEERIKNTCNDYGVPFDIVLAIARLETGWFTSDAYLYRNNPGGLSVNEEPIYFETIEEGVDRFVSNLANNYFAIGLTDPYSIGQKYCPSNPDWAVLVSELMTYGY